MTEAAREDSLSNSRQPGERHAHASGGHPIQPGGNNRSHSHAGETHRAGPSWPFWVTIAAVTTAYLAFLIGMLLATATYSSPHHLIKAFATREIQYATGLSLITCTVSALFALVVAVPVGYLISRSRFFGKNTVDTLLDVPIVLPPMVIGLALLILFQTPFGRAVERVVPFTYTVYGVILAQFVVGAAFAVRQMRTTFDHLSSRPEEVAMTLGCSRGKAVWLVTLPAARRGMFSAASVAWARSLGEFGPILVFAGATRMKTEVLPTSVWLELSVGNLEAAIAVSLAMVVLAVVVLLAMRAVGERP
jgi:molybdate transport system permease protein